MPTLESKYDAAPSTTFSGGIALRGFSVGLEAGLFYSSDPATGFNSVGVYWSFQHSANIPASAFLLQDKSLSEFTMGETSWPERLRKDDRGEWRWIARSKMQINRQAALPSS